MRSEESTCTDCVPVFRLLAPASGRTDGAIKAGRSSVRLVAGSVWWYMSKECPHLITSTADVLQPAVSELGVYDTVG